MGFGPLDPNGIGAYLTCLQNVQEMSRNLTAIGGNVTKLTESEMHGGKTSITNFTFSAVPVFIKLLWALCCLV